MCVFIWLLCYRLDNYWQFFASFLWYLTCTRYVPYTVRKTCFYLKKQPSCNSYKSFPVVNRNKEHGVHIEPTLGMGVSVFVLLRNIISSTLWFATLRRYSFPKHLQCSNSSCHGEMCVALLTLCIDLHIFKAWYRKFPQTEVASVLLQGYLNIKQNILVQDQNSIALE